MLVGTGPTLRGLGLTWTEIVDVLEDAFKQKARGTGAKPHPNRK